MLVLGRKPQESVMINDNIKITLLNVQGQQVKLGFQAPEEIEIHREEVFNKIQQEKIHSDNSKGDK